jgi:DNA-binding MarR family transcriptional regulator
MIMDAETAPCLGRTEREQLERLVEMLGSYAHAVLSGHLLERATGGKLTAAQLHALAFVSRHAGCSTKALSAGLRTSIPSATRLVDRLVRKGLIDRCESGEDRRLVQLRVTPTAETALRSVQEARIAQLEAAVSALPADERPPLLGGLERLLRAMMRDAETVEACCLHCGSAHDRTCVVNTAHVALVGRPIARP